MLHELLLYFLISVDENRERKIIFFKKKGEYLRLTVNKNIFKLAKLSALLSKHHSFFVFSQEAKEVDKSYSHGFETV